MKYLVVCCLAFSAILSVNAQAKKSPVKTPVTGVIQNIILKNLLDSFSYAAGMNIAVNMKQQGISKINPAIMQRAINDVFQNKPKLLTHEIAGMKLQEQLAAFTQKKSAAEKAKGVAFLMENKKRNGVISLPNGLQYEILTAGDSSAVRPTAADTVVVHYAGTLIEGGEPFDSSIKRGEPATFPVAGVIRGWTEILQLMTKGSNWKVYIPSDLAYGDRGAGAAIPPGATLIFEINLLDIKQVSK